MFFWPLLQGLLNPGAKFDLMVILEGEQDIGKSSVWRCLFKESVWFSDSINLSGDDKQILESALGPVIIESAELMGARKAVIERLKAFITRQAERGRLAYGRYTSVIPRRFVLVGTTNDSEGLPSDYTGMRRYLVAPVAAKEGKTAMENGRDVIKYITENRDQLWAEAVHLYEEGENLLLPEDLLSEAAKEAEAHRSRNEALEQGVEDILRSCENFQEGLKMGNILKELADASIIPRGGSMAIQKDIAAILKRNGFEKKHTENGNRWKKS